MGLVPIAKWITKSLLRAIKRTKGMINNYVCEKGKWSLTGLPADCTSQQRASLEGLMRWFCCNKTPGSRLHLCFVLPLGHLITAATVCCTVSRKPAYITTGVQLLMPLMTFCVSLFSSLLFIIGLVK